MKEKKKVRSGPNGSINRKAIVMSALEAKGVDLTYEEFVKYPKANKAGVSKKYFIQCKSQWKKAQRLTQKDPKPVAPKNKILKKMPAPKPAPAVEDALSKMAGDLVDTEEELNYYKWLVVGYRHGFLKRYDEEVE